MSSGTTRAKTLNPRPTPTVIIGTFVSFLLSRFLYYKMTLLICRREDYVRYITEYHIHNLLSSFHRPFLIFSLSYLDDLYFQVPLPLFT